MLQNAYFFTLYYIRRNTTKFSEPPWLLKTLPAYCRVIRFEAWVRGSVDSPRKIVRPTLLKVGICSVYVSAKIYTYCVVESAGSAKIAAVIFAKLAQDPLGPTT